MEQNTLQHYGVLGMKWGVIRSPAQLARARKVKQANKKRQESLAKARDAKAKRKKALDEDRLPAKKMTEAELKAKIERLKLEKDYVDLLKEARGAQMTRGKKFVNKFLDSSIDKIADQAAADVVAQSVKVLMVKMANKALSTDDVFTNNKKK